MEIDSEEIREAGGKAFYDDIPRYKCPVFNYTPQSLAWYRGWDTASEHHRLFTENQRLQIECDSMELEKEKLEERNTHLLECTVRRKEDRDLIITAFNLLCDQVDGIKEQLDVAIIYIDDSSVFSFRREKMLELIFLAKGLCPETFKKKLPEGVKKSPKEL